MLFCLQVQAKRVALVIGNDNYISVSKLQKAGNDATAMARELKNAGFAVQLHQNLNYRATVRAVESFTYGIQGGDEVVVFYAGHGVQIKNGSYLLPTDIEVNSESEVEKTAYDLLTLTEKLAEAKPAFSLVIVDACRDNPLKSKGRSIGNARGLSAIEAPKGQMIVYSASRGQQALDRLLEKDPNPNSVFTRELISRMKTPGVKIEDLMRDVQNSVEELAKSVKHEQRPAIYNETRGNFYFYNYGVNLQASPAYTAPVTAMPSPAPAPTPLSPDAVSAIKQQPVPQAAVLAADCPPPNDTITISSKMAKDSNVNSSNTIVTSSHARTKNPNLQTPIHCNRNP
ncbi:MAG: caspase family protein [Betaproteobacteria bacterium]